MKEIDESCKPRINRDTRLQARSSQLKAFNLPRAEAVASYRHPRFMAGSTMYLPLGIPFVLARNKECGPWASYLLVALLIQADRLGSFVLRLRPSPSPSARAA